jgi:tetratricopeptide (TPR) repeat protein
MSKQKQNVIDGANESTKLTPYPSPQNIRIQILFEQAEDFRRKGYDADLSRGTSYDVGSCRFWLNTWEAVKVIFALADFNSYTQFDEEMPDDWFLGNWFPDFEMSLQNASIKDSSYVAIKARVFSEALDLFRGGEVDNFIENLRMAHAGSLADLGDIKGAETLFRGWLSADPQWGWGWIGFSDLFDGWDFNPRRDLNRSVGILLEALAIPGMNDREEVLERLASAYEDQGRIDLAEQYLAEALDTAPGCTKGYIESKIERLKTARKPVVN